MPGYDHQLRNLEAALLVIAYLSLLFRRCYGLPFASPNGLYNLSKLSVWWLRLGIRLERIKRKRPVKSVFTFGFS